MNARCSICGQHVRAPFEFPKKPGLFGNHVFIFNAGKVKIFQAYCNSHLSAAKNFFPSADTQGVNAQNIKNCSVKDFSWTVCNSQAIDSFVYLPEPEIFGIRYRGQSCAYFFFNVHDAECQEFIASGSKGKFINRFKQGRGMMKLAG